MTAAVHFDGLIENRARLHSAPQHVHFIPCMHIRKRDALSLLADLCIRIGGDNQKVNATANRFAFSCPEKQKEGVWYALLEKTRLSVSAADCTDVAAALCEGPHKNGKIFFERSRILTTRTVQGHFIARQITHISPEDGLK